jgi:hypothetical protein
MSDVIYMNPNGAPEDEMAMIGIPGGTGIMMEWERPISMSCLYRRSFISVYLN